MSPPFSPITPVSPRPEPQAPVRAWVRVSELSRQSLKVRVSAIALKFVLYILLLPAMLSGGVVGASKELGSSWGEAFSNVRLVSEATIETYKTNAELVELSARIALSLEGEQKANDLDMLAYAAEVRSKTSELSASIDKQLADYLKRQVERAKEREAKQAAGEALELSHKDEPTLRSVIIWAVLGALVPLIFYWLLGYLLTRWWLKSRDLETVRLYLNPRG